VRLRKPSDSQQVFAIPEDPEESKIGESITSSDLLAKHNANIARLAQSFGIALESQPETTT
jgi:hypothetical protein